MLRNERIDAAVAVGADPRLRAVVVYLLALFVFTLPIEELVFLPGLGSLTRLVGLVTMPLALLALVEGGRVRFRVPTFFLLASAVFVLWNVLSYFWSVDPSRTLGPAITSVQLLIFVWLVSEFCRSAGTLAMLMQAFVLGNYASLAVAMFLLFQATGAARATGRDPNEFATVLALGIPIAAWLVARGGGGVFRVLNIAYPVFVVLGIVLSASRGGLLVAVVALLAIPFMIAGMGVVRRLVLGVLLTAAVALAFSAVPRLFPQLHANVDRLGNVGVELTEGTLTGRTLIWREGVRIFQSSPLVGVGLGAASPLYAETMLGRERVAHNTFLQIATETGGVGVVLFLVMIVLAAVGTVNMHRSFRPFALILLAAMVVGMMPLSIGTKKFTWFALALVANQAPVVMTVAHGRRPSLADRVGGSPRERGRRDPQSA